MQRHQLTNLALVVLSLSSSAYRLVTQVVSRYDRGPRKVCFFFPFSMGSLRPPSTSAGTGAHTNERGQTSDRRMRHYVFLRGRSSSAASSALRWAEKRVVEGGRTFCFLPHFVNIFYRFFLSSSFLLGLFYMAAKSNDTSRHPPFYA